MLSKQRFTLLIAILFAAGISAEPLVHAHEVDEHHDLIECQVCEIESFKFNDIYLLELPDVPIKQDKKLDLPTPEGPTIATRDPEGIDKSRFRKSHFWLRIKPRF